VRLLTDASGSVTDTYTYDAFGILIHQTGLTPNDYLYAGEQQDSSLGLDYLRARYLNPASGRFWSMDEYEGDSEDPRSLHKYLYVNANPVNFVDPSGLIPLPFPFSVFVGIAVDQFIREDFRSGNSATRDGNIGIINILRERGAIPPTGVAIVGNLLRPDLVEYGIDSRTGLRAVYEIKTIRELNQGVAQIAIYLGLLNAYDPGWGPGVEYSPPISFTVTVLGGVFDVTTFGPNQGVITYDANPRVPRLPLSVISVYVATLITVTATIALTRASLTRGLAF